MIDRELAFRLTVIVAIFAAFAGLLPDRHGPYAPGHPRVHRPASNALPTPSPEPLIFAAVTPDQARAMNAAIAFAADRGPAAKPFSFRGDAMARERAVDCLAAAMVYEAGGDDTGQRAVAQVVLNRVRHPAFPPSICGAVFQGSERSTGCQFTFTCDGAMGRALSPDAWLHARGRASEMLGGAVFHDVGLATHYHTDWVHPVWSAEMDKIARVGTHLFFRWHGWAGTAAASRQGHGGIELAQPRMAALSPFHRAGLEMAEAQAALARAQTTLGAYAYGAADAALLAAAGTPAAARRGIFVIDMAQGGTGGVQAMAVLDRCGARPTCKVLGRLGPSAPEDLRQRIAFVYLRDQRTGMQKSFWNCDIFHRTAASQCLGPDSRRWLAFEPPVEAAKAVQAAIAAPAPPPDAAAR